MKSVLASVITIALTVLAYQAKAECPSSLNAEQMQECIVTENAGYYYSPQAASGSIEEQVIAPATTATSANQSTVDNKTIVTAHGNLMNN